MSVINITQKDIDQLKKVDQGFFAVILESIEEKVNKAKDGSNYIFEFKVTSGDSNKNRYVSHLVSSKNIGYGLIPVVCALEQVEPGNFEPSEIDLDKLIGKTCIIETEHEIYLGRQQVKVKNLFSSLTTEIELTD